MVINTLHQNEVLRREQMEKISDFVMPTPNESEKQTGMDNDTFENNHCCAAPENFDHAGPADVEKSDTEDKVQTIDDEATYPSNDAQTQLLAVGDNDKCKVDKETVGNLDDGEMADNEEQREALDENNACANFVSANENICDYEQRSGSSNSDGDGDKPLHEGKEISAELEKINEVQDDGKARSYLFAQHQQFLKMHHTFL